MKNNKKILSFLLAFLMFIGIVPGNIARAAGEYQGYDLNDGTYQSIALYIKETGVLPNPATDTIAYCFNATRGVPTPINGGTGDGMVYPLYTKIAGTSTNFENSLVVTPIPNGLTAIQLKDAVLKVIYNGLNNDGTNKALQTSLGLTDQEMRDATQAAIWHFTDGLTLTGANQTDHVFVSGNGKVAYYLLTGVTPTGLSPAEQSLYDANVSNVKDAPVNNTLDIFKYTVPSGQVDQAYQNLLSAKFVADIENVVVGDIEFTKVETGTTTGVK